MCICSLYAQRQFIPDTKIYLKGNSTLIGNNILSVDAKKPYNETTVNDFTNLQFIDVDSDPNTFSSSAANLKIIETDAEIEYAALYWSAIYKYKKGKKIIEPFKRKGKTYRREVYVAEDATRDLDVNNILFKTPESDYQNINGQIIFDNFNDEIAFPKTKPYVCYANVTSLLKNNTNLNGTYTVANIKATEGYVAGGASGGWLLYVVYKTDTATPKYFTTYNGFLDVFKKPVDIVFNDFKSQEDGIIETSLLIGALEGDQKFKSDKCSFYNTQNKTYVPIFNTVRPKYNFFNSSISINETVYTDRNPNSKNTFGFDLFKIKLPNEQNTIISNNSSQATIQFSSKADKFYLFFVAFETEITPIYLESIPAKPMALKANDQTLVPEETKKAVEKIKNLKTITVPSIAAGFYLVTNVFSKKANALKWENHLKSLGYTPKSFVNPKNGWTYIYLYTNPKPDTIYNKQQEFLKLKDFENIWVLKINL